MSTSVLLVIPMLLGLSLLGLIGLKTALRRVVPKPAFVIAGLSFLVPMICLYRTPWIGFAVGIFAAAFVLALGFVYGDAARRGMPPALWTLAAFGVPNLVGFLLYFLLRKPLLEPCRQCGQGIAPGLAFCPSCGQPQQMDERSPSERPAQ
jgi:hypothetical protein